MKADAQGFSYLKRDRQYQIPFFQRNYVWDEDNWEEFYDSIIDSINTNKSVFLGSIIIKDTGRKNWDKAIFSIIDGQQRLTTISLFIKAFVDENVESFDRNFNDYQNTLFIYENHTSDQKQLKIIHSKLDKKEFDKCINSEYTNNYMTNNNDSKIFQCYKYFRNRLQNNSENTVNKMKELILNSENDLYKVFVLIEIDKDENEQKIFDTVNSSGVKLTSADIIKNAIFERLMNEIQNEQKVIDLYNHTWSKTFISDDATVKYWENEAISGRIKRERLEVLLHSIAVIKKFYNPQKNKIEDLPNEYKNYIANMNSHDMIEFVNEICDFAELYRKKFVDFDTGHNFSMSERGEVFHKILEMFDTSAFNPYILNLYYKNKNEQISDDQLLQTLLKLEKYIARSLICGTGTNKNFNKINFELINDYSNNKVEELLENANINDSTFKNSMLKIDNNKYARIILYMIMLERLKNEDGMGRVDSLQFTFSLEHIMPQSYLEHWSLEKLPLDRKDNDGEPLSIEDLNNYRVKTIYQIGNMTLLKQKLNSKVSNNNFTIKLNGDNNKKGIKAFQQLSICTEIQDKKIWNEDEIEERTRNLTNEILKIW